MKTKNIRQTLKKNLFDTPKPVKELRHVFYLWNEMMFPGKVEINAFLMEDNYQKSEDIAKRILLRLCYETSFSPPTKLLFNLLDLESNIGQNEKEQFVAKDHFVHLVNLYLLGIYIYFYHESLNKPILEFFKKSYRGNKSLSKEGLSANSSFVFIKAWQYFVLNHDLGYPLEYVNSKKDKKERDENVRFLDPFSKLTKYFYKDVSLKSITKLILLGQILDSSCETFQDRIEPLLGEDDLQKIIFSNSNITASDNEKFNSGSNDMTELDSGGERKDVETSKNFEIREFIFLDKVFGIRALNTVLAVVNKFDIIPVLTRKNEEEPLIFLIPNREQNTHEVIFSDFFKGKKSSISKQTIIENAFSAKSTNIYQWTYYIKPSLKKDFHQSLQMHFPILDKENYNLLSNFLINEANFNFTLISNDVIFSEFSYQLYYSLYHTLDLEADDPMNLTSLERTYRIIIPILGDFHKKLPQQLSSLFSRALEKVLNSGSLQVDSEEKITDFIVKVLTELGDNNKEIAENLTKKVSIDLKEQIRIRKLIFDTWHACRKKIEIELDLNSILNTYKGFSKTLDLSKYSNIFGHGGAFNELFETISSHGYKWDDFQSYKPNYAEKWFDFYDHGISSALVAANMNDIYDQVNLKIANRRKSNSKSFGNVISEISLVELGISESFLMTKDIWEHLNHKVLSEVQFAILMHNIYPRFFKASSKISIKKSPFTYFAILADSLQPWDRKKLLNQAIQKLPYSTYGNRFNLQINGLVFEIHEEGDSIDIKQRIDALRTYLNEYLENASQNIKLSFSEY